VSDPTYRRDLLKLAGIGGVVFASSLFRGVTGCSSASNGRAKRPGDGGETMPTPASGTARGATEDFFFLQISDTHWGFTGPMVNPEPTLELPAVVAAVNASTTKPDFVVFTGDLTHNTDDVAERKQRLNDFKQIVSTLSVPVVKFMPGEHDAGADAGGAYKEVIGDLRWSFDHQGVHFVAIDNVSDPMARVGDEQLVWLERDLSQLDAEAPIVVFAHRPLWDLKPEWDWATADGAKVIDVLSPYHNVTVFFGHIHQELHHMTGHIPHHSARSTMFALPTPDTAGMRKPVPWDSAHPNAGLGYRSVEAKTTSADYALTEIPIPPGADR
jgi:3',5'-cyclic AMP phosphodiesterase CpdA